MTLSKNLLNCGRTYSDSFASQANFTAEHFWNNSMIRIADKTISYIHWANAGVIKINDIMASDLRIVAYSCFKDKFSFPVSFLEFFSVTSAIKNGQSQTPFGVVFNNFSSLLFQYQHHKFYLYVNVLVAKERKAPCYLIIV